MPKRYRRKVIGHPRLLFPPKSARDRIEQTPEMATREMGWYRSKPSELKSMGSFRGRLMLIGGEAPHPLDRSHIHSHHPTIEKKEERLESQGYPSPGDLQIMSGQIKDTNLRFWHVVSVNKHGEVTGYFSMHPSKPFLEKIQQNDPEALKVIRLLNNPPPAPVSWNKSTKSAVQLSAIRLNRLKRLGFITRVTPMPGYHFVKGRFFRMRKRKNE